MICTKTYHLGITGIFREPFWSVLLTHSGAMQIVPVTSLLVASTPLPLDPTSVYKWNPSMKYTTVIVWTYNYSFWDGQSRDLVNCFHWECRANLKTFTQTRIPNLVLFKVFFYYPMMHSHCFSIIALLFSAINQSGQDFLLSE